MTQPSNSAISERILEIFFSEAPVLRGVQKHFVCFPGFFPVFREIGKNLLTRPFLNGFWKYFFLRLRYLKGIQKHLICFPGFPGNQEKPSNSAILDFFGYLSPKSSLEISEPASSPAKQLRTPILVIDVLSCSVAKSIKKSFGGRIQDFTMLRREIHTKMLWTHILTINSVY